MQKSLVHVAALSEQSTYDGYASMCIELSLTFLKCDRITNTYTYVFIMPYTRSQPACVNALGKEDLAVSEVMLYMMCVGGGGVDVRIACVKG